MFIKKEDGVSMTKSKTVKNFQDYLSKRNNLSKYDKIFENLEKNILNKIEIKQGIFHKCFYCDHLYLPFYNTIYCSQDCRTMVDMFISKAKKIEIFKIFINKNGLNYKSFVSN